MAMKKIILGTAGHIDHGKTSFIKALTGIDTDRLKEEKERGITIELGFAHMSLPDGTLVGIVDVPGHERFVKNMVAGASGIDLVALIVAADEGVMPQTKEHIEICQLLGIQYGIVVITKIDMVDNEWLELVRDDIQEYIKNTFLANAPIVEVSSITGEGLNKFIEVLTKLIQRLPKKETGHIFRLPIDRVFTIKGFGTVVTGTTISGEIKVGEEVTIYPINIECKVRSIQVHNQSVTQVGPSTRTALSLHGIDKSHIERGYVVASKGSLNSSYMLDVFIELLYSAPRILKNREKVRLHSGTSEVMANIIFFNKEQLQPGDSCYAQIRLEHPISVLRGDRYVIRSYSPVRTIGGGIILHPMPKKKKKGLSEEIIKRLHLIHQGQTKDIVEAFIFMEGFDGIDINKLVSLSNIKRPHLMAIIDDLIDNNLVYKYDEEQGLIIHYHFFKELTEILINLVSAYHKEYPFRSGMPKGELKSKMRLMKDIKLFNFLIDYLVKKGHLFLDMDSIRLANYRPNLTDKQKVVKKQIEDIYKKAGFQPPYFKEIKDKYSEIANEILEYLIWEQRLIKIKEDLYMHRDSVDELIRKVISFLKKHGEMSVGQFKELTNTSRKYSIPLLEYLDKTQITVRVGDIRRLRRI